MKPDIYSSELSLNTPNTDSPSSLSSCLDDFDINLSDISKQIIENSNTIMEQNSNISKGVDELQNLENSSGDITDHEIVSSNQKVDQLVDALRTQEENPNDKVINSMKKNDLVKKDLKVDMNNEKKDDKNNQFEKKKSSK